MTMKGRHHNTTGRRDVTLLALRPIVRRDVPTSHLRRQVPPQSGKRFQFLWIIRSADSPGPGLAVLAELLPLSQGGLQRLARHDLDVLEADGGGAAAALLDHDHFVPRAIGASAGTGQAQLTLVTVGILSGDATAHSSRALRRRVNEGLGVSARASTESAEPRRAGAADSSMLAKATSSVFPAVPDVAEAPPRDDDDASLRRVPHSNTRMMLCLLMRR